jgi:thiamine-monophosphate kinase
MIDISDGLLQDLGHVASQSKVGAEIWASALPVSPSYDRFRKKAGLEIALSGGEDYELLFCARPQHRRRVLALEKRLKVPVKRIGACFPAKRGIAVLDDAGKPVSISFRGFDHFRAQTRPPKPKTMVP